MTSKARCKALGNYFARLPDLHESWFYSVQTGNTMLLVLDSNQDELSGSQGTWLRSQFNQIPSTADFVFLVFHHPVYTSSSDEKTMGGGHSSRSSEQALGQLLEERQKNRSARGIVVFNSHVHNYKRHEHGESPTSSRAAEAHMPTPSRGSLTIPTRIPASTITICLSRWTTITSPSR